ncbi:MAG: type II secretion system protein [Planctomycetota bacterium]|jgi:prepilin-type N-terminal cleavage/methylation domain-containing protein/prepilin-type processing-associated H-X9-DG protein
MPRKTRAFTLVELLVVVGIIALLVTILMPSLGRALELARRTVCQTQLHAMGRAWQLYFADYNGKLPPKHNPGWYVCDVRSRYNYGVYTGAINTRNPPDFVNYGVLYKAKLIGDQYNFVCPTIKKNVGGVWFGCEILTRDGEQSRTGGWWPVNRRFSTYGTYGRRRFNYYEDPDLSNIGYRAHGLSASDPWKAWSQRADRHIMLYLTGVNAVTNAGDFSWMGDRFDSPAWAMISHVPGVNVSFLDGHATYWPDPTWDEAKGTGKVLYDNGLGSWNDPFSDWYYDDIWMIIDGYHQPPVGQGF